MDGLLGFLASAPAYTSILENNSFHPPPLFLHFSVTQRCAEKSQRTAEFLWLSSVALCAFSVLLCVTKRCLPIPHLFCIFYIGYTEKRGRLDKFTPSNKWLLTNMIMLDDAIAYPCYRALKRWYLKVLYNGGGKIIVLLIVKNLYNHCCISTQANDYEKTPARIFGFCD